MYNNLPNTLFVGKKVFFLPTCHSTNDKLLDLANDTNVPEGSVVITHHQTAGRGQRGNTWEAEAGQNLTFSLLFKPTFLTASQQFGLNMAVAIACYRLLHKYLSSLVSVKWPNDLYFGDMKIGGILIENSVKGIYLSQSVVGIGINVNQIRFSHPRAVSLRAIEEKEYDLQKLLNELLEGLEATYLLLKAGSLETLRQEYLQYLYGFKKIRLFRIGEEVAEGIIRGVDETGKLQVEIDHRVRSFWL